VTLWRYEAEPLAGKTAATKVRGELAGGSGAEVRAALRRAGMQVVALHPVRETNAVTTPLRTAWRRHLRQRRRGARAEFFDGLSTLLESGLPLLESLDALRATHGGRRSSFGSLLLRVREAVRGGESFAEALDASPDWFDAIEVALVRAAEEGGTLAPALRALAERHERSNELAQKIAGALAYPVLVGTLGVGVVAFLATRTLPELVRILTDAGVAAPPLTVRVMNLGQALVTFGPLVVAGVVAVAIAAVILLPRVARSRVGPIVTSALDRNEPLLLRRMRVARIATGLAELLRAGVPLVAALRVLAPAIGASHHAARLREVAHAIEHGAPLADAFAKDATFDATFVRLLDLGAATGELPTLLERLGARERRATTRLVDRLAAFVEPLAILTLAALVGLVALAAVLPFFRLQEVL
jgi:type II secretory pathway component PulF